MNDPNRALTAGPRRCGPQRMSNPIPVEILKTDSKELFEAALDRAVGWLRDGEVAALPTETVYGLAANALDPEAVAKIFEVKGRPAHNPIIVHVASLAMAKRCVERWPALAGKLAAAFWPGPLTLVLPKSGDIPDVVTAGGLTVGVRWPSHPFIQAVIRKCGFPLAAPSANPSNRVSPTTAEHVRRQLGGKIRLIVDGGRSQVGIESTVLDLAASPPRVLRPGMIHERALLSVTGRLGDSAAATGPLRSPGLLRKHYAPRAQLAVLRWQDDADLRRHLAELRLEASRCHLLAHTRIPSPRGFARVSAMPRDPDAFARVMYDELHQCDEAGAGAIVVEAPPAAAEWNGIADRLKRAAA
jgi:L-threonylcarbamoyladenylate synthase